MSIVAIVQPFLIIPAVPEAIEAIQDKYKIIEGLNGELDDKLSDCIS
jgi:hypothetical protein